MRAAGISADAYTYEALAAACGVAGKWESAESVVREMIAGCAECAAAAAAGAGGKVEDGMIAPTTATAAAAATAAARSPVTAAAAAGGATDGDAAAGGGSGGVGVEPAAAEAAAAAVGTAASSNSHDGDNATAWTGGDRAVLAPPPAVGDSPPSSSSSATTATAGESWNQKLRLELRQRRRQEQLKNGVPPSPRVFHGLMEAYARAGEWERALECLDDMLHGLNGSLEEEQPVDALGQERVGVGAGVKPDSTSVGWAIQVGAVYSPLCSAQKKKKKAKQETPKKQPPAIFFTYGTVNTYRRGGWRRTKRQAADVDVIVVAAPRAVRRANNTQAHRLAGSSHLSVV